jgi:hypothetical protein
VKRNRILHLLLLGLCLFCLMGISKSRQVILSVKVPLQVFKIPDDIPNWNWDEDPQIDGMSIVEWDKVMKSVDESPEERHEYYISLNEFETLLRNNIFLLTRIGIYNDDKPTFWDVDYSVAHSRTLHHPNAYALSKMLTDSKQNSKREAFVKAAIRILKDPKTKTAWNQQREEYCDDMIRIWRVEAGQWGWFDYQRALNIDYDSAISMAINETLKSMKCVDFSAKVIPDGYQWRIARVINTYYEFFTDPSPFGIQSACFRMGPEATDKLIGYIERSLEGTQQKKKK